MRDHQAQLIAKNDAKFLAKLTGSSWCLKKNAGSANTSSSSRSSSPAAGQVQSPVSGSSRRATGAPSLWRSPEDDAVQQQANACSTESQQQGQPQPQQQQASSPAACGRSSSSKASHESPQWLLRAAADPPPGAPGSTRALHGARHAESSLYAAWATSAHQPADSPDRGSRTVAPVLTRPQPASPLPAGAASHARAGSPASRVSTGRTTSPLRQATPSCTCVDAAADCTTTAAAATLPGSPCGSNYHSSRAATLAAGISRVGAVSPEQQQWFRREHPGASPPRREDKQQLWKWLEEELHKLRQQLQPQTTQAQAHEQEEQTQRSASSCNRITTAASPAAADSSSDPSKSSSSRSGSPGPRGRDQSPGRLQTAEGSGLLQSTALTALEQQAQQLTAVCRGPHGMLQAKCMQAQRELYSAAFHEVCRQVGVGCVERVALMAQLWGAQDCLLQAALQDRQAARQQCAAAEAASEAAVREQQRLQQLEEDEKVALRAIRDRHAAKAAAAKEEFDALKLQHDKLQELLTRLSGAQQLMQRVMDLEAANQEQASSIEQLQAQLVSKQDQLERTSTQLQGWQGRAQLAEAQAAQQEQQLGVSTPRPKRDLGLLCDLVEPPLQQLIEQAVIEGIPAAHVHRLLLGLSTTCQDMRPWLQLAGSCVPALRRASDPGRIYHLLQQHLAECNGAALSSHLSRPEHLQLLSTAVHLGTDSPTLLGLLVGSFGLPATSHAAAASFLESSGLPAQQLRKSLSSAGPAAAAGSGLGIGIGLHLLPLVGVLADKCGHAASELGGPVTEALVQARLSTVARVQDLEARCRSLHREVVMLKCTLAEQHKHEAAQVEEALRDQKRKIARREARQPTLLEKFLQTKWGSLFNGIGMSEDVPRVLRANVPVNNKQMSKREAERLATEIWAFKDDADASAASPITLAEATAVFLERRFFAIPRLVTEVAYNLIYSLAQHIYDTDCNLFLRVLSGEVDESVRHEQQLLEGEIMRMLKLLDMSINHQATGWLHKADVKTALAGFFKGKKVDRLAEVLEALDTDEPGEALHYAHLFSDDDDLNQGLTAEIIRSQHLTERLEFLQEIEDYIRDAAEDNGTTSLTPAMLEACLRKAHKRLDGGAASEYVCHAFGPDWEASKHRLAQPLGAVIRAVRSGGLPNMVRPAAGPSGNVAGAVSRIVPVGRFRNKLVTALKVGFNKDTKDREAGGAAAAGAQRAKSRRATQEAVSAAVAAVLSGDGSRPSSSLAVKQTPADTAAAAAVAGSSPAPSAPTAPSAAAATAATQSGQQSDSATASAAAPRPPSAATSTTSSRPGTANPRSHSPPRLLIPEAATTQQAVPSPATVLSGTPLTPSAAAAARTLQGAAARSSAAYTRALTVDVLSAMEAVRQSWLLEEEVKMVSSLSGSGAAAAKAQPPGGSSSAGGGSEVTAGSAGAAEGGISFSMTPHQLQQHTPAAAAGFFLMEGDPWQGPSGPACLVSGGVIPGRVAASASGSGGRAYDVPAVPALRLSEAGLLGSPGTASSLSLGTDVDSSRCASGTFRSSIASSAQCSGRTSCYSAGGDAGLLKPGLVGSPETPKRTKHVQISTEDNRVFAFQAAAEQDEARSPNPGTSLSVSWPQQQQQQQQAGACANPARFSRQESGQVRQQTQLPASAAAAPGQPVSRSSSGNSRRPGSSGAGRPPAGSDGTTVPLKPRGSRSSKLAVQLPQLLLTDADDACAAEQATSDEHSQVCFTPQAPQEGGKRNAILMRRLNKCQSLKKLEGMMLAVAEGED